MATKLALAEGLPGSGKSTTAQAMYDELRARGIRAALFSEGNLNHPADFDGAAYFDDAAFAALLRSHADSAGVLESIAEKYHIGYILPYRRAMEERHVRFCDALMADIARNDVYELPLMLHMELIERRWSAFAQECLRGDTVYVFECCFIQNPVTVTMIRSDSPKEVTAGFVRRLADAVAPLDPVLVYVEQASIRESFRKAVSERPAQWLEGFTQYYLNQGYGLRRGLAGMDGVIEVLEARGALEREICGGLAMPVYRVDNSAFDREALQRRVAAIVEENFAR